MRSEPLVNLALTLLGCTQKELAGMRPANSP